MVHRFQPVPRESEKIQNEALNGKKSLRLSRRLEPSHLPLPLPGRLVRDFGSIVRVRIGVVVHRRHDRPQRSAVTLQFVGDNAKRNLALSLQELDKEAFRCATVTPGLDEDVDHVAVLIHCTPEILPFAVDRNKDFVQEPRITETALSSFQFPCVLRTEFRTPLSSMIPRFASRSSTSRSSDPEAERV